MRTRSYANVWPARETKLPATTLSPALSGNELKPTIALGNGTRRPLNARGSTGIALTARDWAPPPLAPQIQPAPAETDHRTSQRAGRADPFEYRAPWSTLTATALTKLDIREGFIQRHSAANPANTRRGTITAGVLLRPHKAETRHNSVARFVWQRTQARNTSRERERDTPPAGIALTACDSGPLHRWHPRFSPRLQRLTTARGNVPVVLTRSNTARDGATWSTLTATALTKLDIHEGFLQRHSAASPANTRRGTITAAVLLRPHEAEAHQRMLSLTPTSRTRRLARTGSTFRHARHPAGTMTPSWMATSATTESTRIPRTNLTGRSRLPRIPRNLNLRLQETKLTPGHRRRGTSTPTVWNPSLRMKTNQISRSQPSWT